MKRTDSRWAAAIALAAVLATGCQFSASASGSAKTGGDVEGDADASFEASAEADTGEKPEKSISLEQGRLAYEGVINFEYNKADLKEDDQTKKTMNDFKAYLEKYPEVNLRIEGHTDSRGSDEYNRKLSDRRANTVRDWLVDNGIDEERLTSVGKGEDEPKEPEPAECDDQEPEDTTPCEATWERNRRVVFAVTEGEAVIREAEEREAEQEAEAVEPEPEPEPEEKVDECPWLWGGHLNALGPNSWVMLAGATQPGICWLELSLDVGLGFGGIEAESASANADGSYLSFTIPLRGRFWFMNIHSVIADLGLGITHYRISADATDGLGNKFEYKRHSTPFIGHLGVGYGWRPEGSQPGFRLAIVIGGLMHFTGLSDPDVTAGAGFNPVDAAVLQNGLDSDSGDLEDLEPYGEISLGLLF